MLTYRTCTKTNTLRQEALWHIGTVSASHTQSLADQGSKPCKAESNLLLFEFECELTPHSDMRF